MLTAGEPHVYRMKNRLVGAIQFTPAPPSGDCPAWLHVAALSGLVRTALEGLQVMLPGGWVTLQLGEWIVWTPEERGLRVFADRDFQRETLLADQPVPADA